MQERGSTKLAGQLFIWHLSISLALERVPHEPTVLAMGFKCSPAGARAMEYQIDRPVISIGFKCSSREARVLFLWDFSVSR